MSSGRSVPLVIWYDRPIFMTDAGCFDLCGRVVNTGRGDLIAAEAVLSPAQ